MATDDTATSKLRRFTPADLRVITDWIARAAERAKSARNKRSDTRYMPPKHPLCRAFIEHMGGSTVERLVFVSDMSSGGLGVVHHGYVHAGAEVRLELTTVDGERVMVNGEVRWCEYMSNKLHVLGIELSERVTPKYFIEESVWLNQSDGDQERTWVRSRTALCVSGDEIEAAGLGMLLKNANIESTTARSLGAAMDLVEREQFDIVIADESMGDGSGEEIVNKLVSRLYSGPIVVLSSNKSVVEDSALAAGASAVMEKPVQMTPLLAMLRDIFEEAEDASGDTAPILTSLSVEQCPDENLESYLSAVTAMASRLNECISSDNVEQATSICASMHSTGSVYGMDALSKAAGVTLQALRASGSVSESKGEVRRLIKTVGRLRSRDGSRVAA